MTTPAPIREVPKSVPQKTTPQKLAAIIRTLEACDHLERLRIVSALVALYTPDSK